MLLEAAMPTAMIEPISDSTLRVVRVRNSIHSTPLNDAGTTSMMRSGSIHDWNRTTSSR